REGTCLNFEFTSIVCACVSSGTASGAAPNAATKLLRFRSVIAIPFFRFESRFIPAHSAGRAGLHKRRLRVLIVVADVVDLCEQHHGVVFVHYVVAVQRELADEVAEAEENL